jgi:raffinose/stachyose/melibiose transport system substrate-binding protein
MKKTKLLSLVLSTVLATSVLAGCASKESKSANSGQTGSAKEVKITFLNSKGEIQSQMEDAAKAFTKDNPNIQVEVIAAPAGGSPFEKVTSMYASGNAPSLSMLDPGDILKFSDKFLDLTNEKWVADAADKSLDVVKTNDGKVMAFPVTVEGAGIIYNKNVLDKAGVDPKAIKTTKDLEDAFNKVKAQGVDPVAVAPMDWSLAGHLLPIAYATQSKDSKEISKFLEDLKAGKVDLTQNKQFNGVIDTFDVLKKYNVDSKDPLAGTYENDQQLIGSGKVGFWFMGNWAWPQIKDFAGDNSNFGFIPVPVSNNAGDYGNAGIPVGVTKFIGVDKANNNEEQQAAAKKFLEWLVYNSTGQDILVNKANVIPAFKNITLEPNDPLGKSIKSYMNSGNTIQFMTIMPPDHWKLVGASMQKYLADKVDRAGLAKEVQDYWKTVK